MHEKNIIRHLYVYKYNFFSFYNLIKVGGFFLKPFFFYISDQLYGFLKTFADENRFLPKTVRYASKPGESAVYKLLKYIIIKQKAPTFGEPSSALPYERSTCIKVRKIKSHIHHLPVPILKLMT